MSSGNGRHAGQPLFRSPTDLRPEVADALLRWGLSLADSKHKLGMRISEWANGGPSLEASVGACALTQEELGHARSLYAMLRDFPGAPPELGSESDLERSEYRNPALLDEPWDSWLQLIVFNVLLDRALAVAVEALRHSQYAPMRQRAAKILQEEEHHRIFGESWLKRLAELDEKTRRRLQRSLAKCWEAAVAFLGPDDDKSTALLFESGILDAPACEQRESFKREAQAVLQEQRLQLPSGPIDWLRWDPLRRQITPPKGPPCVHCGSTDTEQLSQFGPTLLLTQYYCRRCHSPFERVRLREKGTS